MPAFISALFLPVGKQYVKGIADDGTSNVGSQIFYINLSELPKKLSAFNDCC